MKLRGIILFRLQWDDIGGFRFNFILLDIEGESREFDGSLLGAHINSEVFTISLLFFDINIKSPIY